MKYLIYFFAVIVLFGINLGFFTFFKVQGAVPNLVFLLVVIFSLEKENYDFFFLAVLGGLLLDFYSGVFIGGFSFAILIIGFILHLLVHNVLIFEAKWKYLVFIIAAVLALNYILVWAYQYLAVETGMTSVYLNYHIMPENIVWVIIYNLLLLYPVYRFAGFLKYINEQWFVRQRKI